MTVYSKFLETAPNAILFDWDNTLVDTMDCYVATINHTLKEMDMPTWTDLEVRQRIQLSARDGLPILFGNRWPEAYKIFSDYYMNNHLPYLKPLPGALQLLETLKKLSIPLGIVSNKRGPLLRQEINFLGWDNYFNTSIGAGDAVKDKPDPEPAQLALSNMGISTECNIWFIGDAPVDWQCAEAIGCVPIPIGFGHSEAEKYQHAVADCHALEKMLLKK